MSDTIYVVCGSVGEYSDRSEWMVAWYTTRDEATAHAEAAEAEARDLAVKRQELMEVDYLASCEPPHTPLDPFRDNDYCGQSATYGVAEIERGKWPFALPPKGGNP